MQQHRSLEQILGLAPDRFIAKSSRALAFPKKWDALGRAEQIIWGEFPQINRPPLRAAADTNGPAFFCTCRSRKSPCRHSLALLQLATTYPDQSVFAVDQPPSWVTRWIKRSTKDQAKQRLHQPLTAEAASAEQAKLALLQRGMAELAVWLEDIVRGGMAEAADRPKETWSRMANRLIDAQAGLLALRIQHLHNLIAKHPDWPDPFLKEIGFLYLLARSFARFETLSEPRQLDLRTAAGWLPKSFDHQIVRDEWQVIGRKTSQIRRQFYYRTWLWSRQHNRPALVARATHSRLGGASLLTTGDRFIGEMGYAPSAYPIIAERIDATDSASSNRMGEGVPAGLSIQAALTRSRDAQTANPWLTHYPLLLSDVWPEKMNGRWLLVDRHHTALLLTEKESYVWHLLAESGGRPITLFGEWDGAEFWPLSLRRLGRWIDCHALGGNLN